MATECNKRPPIKFTGKDFESIKKELVNYAKVYYPDTYQDFNEASFGSLMLDMVAYVGDILSFYADYQTNESFLDSAVEAKNILRLAKTMGYKLPGAAASSGICAFYVEVPAVSGEPNNDLIPILIKGTTLSSKSGASFILNENVDFTATDAQIVVAEVDSNGVPTSFAFKSYGEVISGELATEFHDIGSYERFLKIKMDDSNISEVISIYDAQGHEFFEVDYLSQNLVYRIIRNRLAADKEHAPYVLREKIVPRRYIVEHTTAGETIIQFGYGSEDLLKTCEFPDPSAAVLQVHSKDYYSDESFDPSLLIKTDKFGVVPSAGTLTIKYRKNATSDVNVSTGAISTISNAILSYPNTTNVDTSTAGTIRNSVQVDNEASIVGQVSALTPAEIRIRAIDAYAAQHRAVTKQDYLSLVYRMPSKLGAVKRANIIQDPKSFKRNLNLYVVSEDRSGDLIKSPQTVKENVKTWLSKYKMINDTIDILDGQIVNIGIEFEIVGVLDMDQNEILTIALNALRDEYADHFIFGQPFYISDVYKVLNDLPEVIDTTSVKITNKRGVGYSSNAYDVEENVSADGRFIVMPDDMVLEIKNPEEDILGVIV